MGSGAAMERVSVPWRMFSGHPSLAFRDFHHQIQRPQQVRSGSSASSSSSSSLGFLRAQESEGSHGHTGIVCLPLVMLPLHTHISSAYSGFVSFTFSAGAGRGLVGTWEEENNCACPETPVQQKPPGGGGGGQSRPRCHWEPFLQGGANSSDLSRAPCLNPVELLNRIQHCSLGTRNRGNAEAVGRIQRYSLGTRNRGNAEAVGRRAAEGLYRH